MTHTQHSDQQHRALLQSIAHQAMIERGLLPTFSDAALDELRADIAALRRRIKVQAEGRVLNDDQLEQFADSVAERLARVRSSKGR